MQQHKLRTRMIFALLSGVTIALAGTSLISAEDLSTPLRSVRQFRLTYGATLKNLPAGRVRVWVPVPPSDSHQTVRAAGGSFPTSVRLNREQKYGNRMLYFELSDNRSEMIAFSRIWSVRRKERRGLDRDASTEPLADDAETQFILANRLVPIAGRPLKLLEGIHLPDDRLKAARVLYDRVAEHVNYDKSQPGYGNGDSNWVCDSRFGNCTDFHSLFISLSRSQKIPARFEIGFPVPDSRSGEIAGYHCWASFHTKERGWIPVDISEADKNPRLKEYYFGNLTADRVHFTTGRDITLVPQQDGPPLNYFIYPYVEVNGKPWPSENVKVQIRYKDEGEGAS